jgi:hypothetical protein
MLRSAGFKSVNVLKGGITAYGRFITENPSIDSLYKGRNFTFDRRLGERITDDIISQCHTCGKPCNTHTNCRNSVCNLLFIQCEDCRIRLRETCGNQVCLKIVEKMLRASSQNVSTRPGVEPWYEHGIRTRPKAVLERYGGRAKRVSQRETDQIILGKSQESFWLGLSWGIIDYFLSLFRTKRA